jgi:hypothetical protein
MLCASAYRLVWLPLAVLMLCWLPAQAQVNAVGFKSGDSVVVAVPTVLMLNHRAAMSITRKFDIDARSTDGVTEVFDSSAGIWHANWRSMGFASAGRYDIDKIKTVDREGYKGKFIEVTINTATPYADLRLFVPENQPEVVRTLIAPSAVRDSVLMLSYEALDSAVFVGPLAAFTPSERLLILQWANVTASGTHVGSEEFKGVTYMAIVLPSNGNVWNDLRVTRSQRIGKAIGAQLPLLKAFAKLAMQHGVIGGLKLQQPVAHGTAPNYTDTTTDTVEAYFPLAAVVSFADADITSQALVNHSIILVNGDRVEVDLSTQ